MKIEDKKGLINEIEEHRIFGIIRGVKGWPEAPLWFKENINRMYAIYLKRFIELREEGLRIFRLLKKRKIDFILLKGIYLSELLYGKNCFRPCDDIDILIRKEDNMLVKNMLFEIGYEPFVGRDDFMFTRHFKEEILCKGDYVVDLHTGLYSEGRFKYDISHIFKNRRLMQISKLTVPILSLEDTFFHLLLHSAAHFFRIRMINSLDIALFIKRFGKSIDWIKLSEIIRKDGNHIASYFPLMFVIKNFYVLPSKKFLEGLEPDIIRLKYYNYFIDYNNPYLLKEMPVSWFKRVALTLPAIYGMRRKVRFIFWYIVRRGDEFIRRKLRSIKMFKY